MSALRQTSNAYNGPPTGFSASQDVLITTECAYMRTTGGKALFLTTSLKNTIGGVSNSALGGEPGRMRHSIEPTVLPITTPVYNYNIDSSHRNYNRRLVLLVLQFLDRYQEWGRSSHRPANHAILQQLSGLKD